MDSRWSELANLLVNYSVSVKAGERVMIAMGEVETFDLAMSVYTEVVRAGGYPQVQFLSEKMRHSLIRYGSDELLSWVPEIEAFGMDWADVYIGLRGAVDLDLGRDLPASRLAINQEAMGKVSTLRWQKTRWCLVRVPNSSMAKNVGLDPTELLNMFFKGSLIDWEDHRKKWASWASNLEKGSIIRIEASGTDLSFSVQGRQWVVFDGKANMPDGEIATAPHVKTVHGSIAFENPGIFGGRLIPDIVLRWDHGVLVEANSSAETDFLRKIIATDDGASLIGEFAIGVNPRIEFFVNDILIDEKIAGTVHIALGRAYPECGGVNQSSIHWDIVKDTRNNSKIYLDDALILNDGRLLLEDL